LLLCFWILLICFLFVPFFLHLSLFFNFVDS
jgi:hypothetical protein